VAPQELEFAGDDRLVLRAVVDVEVVDAGWTRSSPCGALRAASIVGPGLAT
jgi:hypothetical protein